jgi:hypothetical protein
VTTGVLGGVEGVLVGGVEGGVTGGLVGGVADGVPGGVSDGEGESETTGTVGGSSSALAGCDPKASAATAISSSGNILAELAITALPRSQTLVSLQQYARRQRA